ncbi:MAG TPA: arsenosugar biosynthesis radical SAM (seleno)protein ArsS [Polyangiales bacterium]|nr:arsenosugar biosynthesis radical SAM (seleno)protein ArsS [Polyangiales bacterium]
MTSPKMRLARVRTAQIKTALEPDFDAVLAQHRLPRPAREKVTTLQLNLGKRCNMACHHCHVEAGPKRTETMPERVVERVLSLLARSPNVEVVDLTGGAPELHRCFRALVHECRAMGKQVIDRCNLTVLFEPGAEGTAEFLAQERVRVVASLPCYQRENVEKQRGKGAYDLSIAALRKLNALGYGSNPELMLDLVYNPGGAFLPPPQAGLQADYERELFDLFGIRFNALLTITNMPIKRFADQLNRTGQHAAYMGLLVDHFNPETVSGVMCRSTLSVAWDGQLHDCDFNQMLELPLSTPDGPARSVWDLASLDELCGAPIATRGHCFGCTAGAGSSCSGALA